MRAFRLLSAVLPLAVFLIAPTPAHAALLEVPADFPTIQAAINAASPGDTVLVSPGIYAENINFQGKAITVTSQKGPKKTIIDGGANDSVATFASGEGPGSTLNGFTLRNGRSGFDTPGFGDGGGIRISSTSPTITGNRIVDNRACAGPGISIKFGSSLIQGNTISRNQQHGCSGGIGGGGIRIGGSGTARVLDNVISDNTMTSANGGGIALFSAGTPTIQGNTITGNTATGISPCAAGGGISMVNFSDALIAGNLITGNSAGCGGGISWGVPSGFRGPLLVNNTIADNDSAQGSGIFADGFDTQTLMVNNIIVAKGAQTAVFCGNFDANPPMFKSNDVFSPTGSAYGGICTNQTGLNDNISADPIFVNPGSGDYHLQAGSPVIDKGDNSAPSLPANDLDGDPRKLDGDGNGTVIVDMGADEFNPGGPTAAVAGSLAVGGNPVVGAQVTLKNTATRAKRNTSTDGAGRYQFDPVPAGPYQITVKTVSVASTAAVSGNLRVKGLPSAGNTVKLKNLGTGFTVSTSTDAAGNFSFAGVQPGSYKLSIMGVTVP
jgi:parallel beta-helix repeat protein